jgi:hypothetical protein
MGELATSLGHTLCTIVMVGGGSGQCYNAAAMHSLGTFSVLAVVMVALGYRALSRF